MSPIYEDCKRTVIRFYDEVVNGKAPDALTALLHPEFRDHTSNIVFLDVGQFPVEDISVMVEELIGEGDLVVSRWRATGTTKGDAASVSWNGATIFRVIDGKIGERWAFPDLGPVVSTLVDALGRFTLGGLRPGRGSGARADDPIGDGTPIGDRTATEPDPRLGKVVGDILVRSDVPLERMPALVDVLLREFFGSTLAASLRQIP